MKSARSRGVLLTVAAVLTDAHIKATERKRRIVVNYDALAHLFGYKPPGGKPDLDSVKSHLLGLLDHPVFKRVPEGLDLVRLCCDETTKKEWAEFSPPAKLLVVGKNLVSIRFARPQAANSEAVNIEKVELHVAYS